MSKPPPPKRTSSGNHPAVVGARAKMDSITENTVPRMEEAIAALDRVLAASNPPGATTERPPTPIPQLAVPPPLPSVVAQEETPLPVTPTQPSPSSGPKRPSVPRPSKKVP